MQQLGVITWVRKEGGENRESQISLAQDPRHSNTNLAFKRGSGQPTRSGEASRVTGSATMCSLAGQVHFD